MAKILVADDLPHELNYLQTMISRRYPDVEIISATNGVEALWRARCLQPDVVIIDNQMPRMDGTEAARRMRARGYDMPIYLWTSNPWVVTAKEIGLTGVVDKAESITQLFDRELDAILQNSE